MRAEDDHVTQVVPVHDVHRQTHPERRAQGVFGPMMSPQCRTACAPASRASSTAAASIALAVMAIGDDADLSWK
ncbi:MAG: hypothetical protein M5U07_18705 [Xanthobacteraceae bacterium]|nr:hypothetical protein [Xanthobacteraceae bacterium]